MLPAIEELHVPTLVHVRVRVFEAVQAELEDCQFDITHGGEHCWVKDAGEPPEHPTGFEEVIVLVCVPEDEQVVQGEYVKDVQEIIGGEYVQDWVVIGEPPAQPDGDDKITVLVWVLFDWQVPQSEYVKKAQVGGVGEITPLDK